MELKSCTYATVTTLGDFGPWISKVVLDLPCTVRANDIDARTFHIYVERHERTGEILMCKERGADHAAPSVGYVDVLAAYPCDECGRKLALWHPCGARDRRAAPDQEDRGQRDGLALARRPAAHHAARGPSRQ